MTRGSSHTFAKLVAVSDIVSPSEYRLGQEECVIGRSPDMCNVVINNKFISRIQAKVENKGSHFILSSLGRNPTFVNMTEISGNFILQDGDTISFSHPAPLIRFVDEDPTFSATKEQRLMFDERKSLFILDEKIVPLTPSQFRLLLHLYRNINSVCSRESCAKAIWQDGYLPMLEIDNLDKVINGVRKQLASIAPDFDQLKNRRGLGYILESGTNLKFEK